ncbi:MAG: O-acetylhomoserine aminocarboxypropyltransferase/cysteine synthase family protein [Chloroflexota bacterium]
MSENGSFERELGYETRALHAGYHPDPATGARAVPIYQTTSYQFRDTQHAADLFALREPGNIYTRIMNPTNGAFEERLAALEGGIGAIATSSGQSAELITFLSLAQTGDEIVAASALYGGTYTLLKYTLSRLGITTHFVNGDDAADFEQYINDKTRLIYVETVGNPKLTIPDFEGLADLAHSHGLPLVTDNTFAPYICRPFEHGVDIINYSTTKWIGGHGLSIGGAIVDAGKFDWKAAGRHATLIEPEPAYQNVVLSDFAGPAAFIARTRVVGLRDMGASQSPFNSFLNIIGLETLALRMERHVANAQKVAEFLNEHPAVSWVNYPGLPNHPSYDRARKYLTGGPGSMIGFGIRGGRESGAKFINSLKLFSHLANVGDARSLAIHPATTTHQQLTAEEQVASGVTDDYIRLSIGVESIDDILWDLDQALKVSTGQKVQPV